MKSIRIVATLALGLALGSLVMQAEDAKPAAPAPAKAKCCMKAEKAGTACTHECCEAAAKEGKNCEKCGGKN